MDVHCQYHVHLISYFGKALSNLHPAITFTVESSEYITPNRQQLNFLEINLLLTDNLYTETKIYYKVTISDDYLIYHSYHQRSTIKNIPFKGITTMFKICNFPHSVILYKEYRTHSFKAQHQIMFTIPLTTTHYPQLQLNSAQSCINNMLLNIKDKQLKEKFQSSKVILARKQPNNLFRLLSKAAFTSSSI